MRALPGTAASPKEAATKTPRKPRNPRRTTGIRLMLVDPQRMLREALRTILGNAGDIAVIAEAEDGAAALRLARELAPAVVVMEIGLAGMSGIETTRRMLAENSRIRVLGLSTFADQRAVLQMLEAGASGYVDKSAGSDELLRGIRALAQGGTYLYAVAAEAIVASLRKHSLQGRPTEALGRREREVLQLLASGKTSTRIAATLGIATGTVEVHRRNIMRKLDLHNVAELTRYAIREGLTSA
jgi:DNA-binding NarL/FixJ family response regulator